MHMNKMILAATLLIACIPAWAKPSPEQMSIIGEWSGHGDNIGNAFNACATFSPYMDNMYVHLDYRVHYQKPSSLPDMQSEYFYYFLDNGKLEGISLDSQSNVFQLGGNYDRQSANLQWFKNGKVIGESQWQLSADGKTLSLRRFGQLGTGEVMEIGSVLFNKLPKGQRCHP
jgi:hypothetical protein